MTGAAGFIGSTLAENLADRGFDVAGIDNFHPYYDPAIKRQNVQDVREAADDAEGSFTFMEGSILNDDDLDALPARPQFVFHEAAIAGVRYSVEHPAEYSELNVLGTSKLLDRFRDVEKFVAASSSSVYGERTLDELPVSENVEPRPIAPYPLSKVQMEQLLELFDEQYGVPTVALRYFSVYGQRQRPDEAFTKFISMVLNGDPVTIYGDGEQSRDFTHVDDIVEGTLAAAHDGRNVYNLGSQRRVTVNDLVDVLEEVMDEDVERTHVEQPAGDVSHTHADISKARQELGYDPEIGFEEGAKSCVDWVRRMHDKGLL